VLTFITVPALDVRGGAFFGAISCTVTGLSTVLACIPVDTRFGTVTKTMSFFIAVVALEVRLVIKLNPVFRTVLGHMPKF